MIFFVIMLCVNKLYVYLATVISVYWLLCIVNINEASNLTEIILMEGNILFLILLSLILQFQD